jgi:DNA primase
MTNLATIKAANPLAKIVDRYAEGPRRVGGRTFWLCPFHDEKTPSFTLTPDGGAFICFGCGARGDLFDFLKHAEGLDIKEAVTFLVGNATPSVPPRISSRPRQDDDSAWRTKAALTIWREAGPAERSPVEKYLRGRGITIPIPQTIRHHPCLFYNPSGLRFHGMVAAVQASDRRIVAIHRTFLLADGRVAQVASPKMMLGPCSGGAVRLGPINDRLVVAEGIENAFAAMQLNGIPAWAAMSTSGIRSLALPPKIHEVVIATDGDEPGRQAARQAAERWTRNGVRVRIKDPGDGRDPNDVLLAETAHG